MNSTYLLWFGAAFILCLLLAPIFGRLSTSVGLIDYPSSRKFHLTTMPLMGGLAVGTSFLAIYLAATKGTPPSQLIAILAASFLTLSLGLIDDVRNISPKVKLLGQFIAAGILLAAGLGISMTGIKPIDWILTIIWFAGIVNCMNLLDNIDGLSGGTAAIAGAFFFFAAAITGKSDTAVAAAVFSGACMGFLFHNFHPATIFSGDAGSMFMGSMLASFGLLFMKDGAMDSRAVAHLFPGVILGLLIFDTGLVSIMRTLHGKKITDGGKDHTSHRLCNLGLSVQASVVTLFIVCFIFGAAGVAMLRMNPGRAVLIPIVLFSISIICWFLMGKLYNYNDYGEKTGN